MYRIIFFGTPEFVVPILETLQNHFNLVGVVTTPDHPVGRKQEITPSAIAEVSSKFKTPVLKPEKFTDLVVQSIQKLQPDLLVVAAYGKIIPGSILKIPKFGAINIHPSLLPKYRGASPIQSAILNGDSISGISIIKMDTEMDHGPVIFTRVIRLSGQDNFEMLSKTMFTEAAEALPDVIRDFVSGKIKLRVQRHAIASYCNPIKKEDGYFNLNNPPSPEKLDRMVRAFYPWPTVWTKWQDKIVKFYPGGLVRMEGKKAVPLKDFLNGYPDFPLKSI